MLQKIGTGVFGKGELALTLMRGWVVIPPVLQKFKELLRPTFLKQAHQWALDRFHLRTGYL
jgi:hypothetical protein